MFDQTLFHLMRVVLQEHTARWAGLLPDVTKPQYAVLEALDTCGEMDQITLGEASASTKGTLAEMVVRMEARGLISRRADEQDSRRRLITLTEQGRAALEVARPLADSVERSMLAQISLSERRTLITLLGRVRRHM